MQNYSRTLQLLSCISVTVKMFKIQAQSHLVIVLTVQNTYNLYSSMHLRCIILIKLSG